MELKESFDSAPKRYDDARPSYPEEVIDWIIEKTGVTPVESLLEIGPGTGQATLKFAERGYSITCIERGKNLARLLLQKCEGLKVSVEVGAFEDWRPQSGYQTPLIFCASAFHWLDKNTKYQKCFDLLKDGGYLALLWNISPDITPDKADHPITKAFDLLWKYLPEKNRPQKTKAEADWERKQEIESSGLFALEGYLDYPWIFHQNRESLTQWFFTQSVYLSLEEAKQKEISAQIAELLQDLDERMDSEIYTTVYLARKKT